MKKIAFLILAFFTTVNLFSQDLEGKKPKIGLVLSGGGAKGFAHIGVLKVLEQAGVKIDYIGGTSMGAVVGGLYASGYKAQQIDSIFKSTDFDALLSDYIARSSKNFYEKRNDEMYSFSLPFRKLKIGIPTAISKGLYNYNLLNKLTSSVRHVRDFSQLPIPFLCIATDIETGEEVLLNKGYLPRALLASGAFPTLFAPVEVDGKLLIDGGVTNNFPVEEVRKMGADIIIGVDVQDDLKDRKSLQEATRVLVQITNLQMIEKMKQKVALTNIYIKPEINDFGVISFNDGQEIIKKGEEAAFAQYEKIKKLRDSTLVYSSNKFNSKSDTLDLENIKIEPLKKYTRAYVIGKLRMKQAGKVTYDDIRVGMDNLASTQNFSAISYQFEKNNNKDDLVLALTENPTKTFLKFAIHYDPLFKTSALINFTQKNSIFRNDVASLDFIVGDNVRFNFEYYVDNGFYWSFGVKSKYNRFSRNVETDFSDGFLLKQSGIRSLNINYSEFTNQFYLQTIFVQKFLVGGGIEHKHLDIGSATLNTANAEFEKSDYASFFGYLKYDDLDNKYFPKKGWYFFGDVQSYLFSTDYTKEFNDFSIAKGDIGFAKTIFKKTTLKMQAEMGFAFGNESVHFFDFVLGGYGFTSINNFRPFYGYDFLSLSGDSYVKSDITIDYEFYKKNHVNISANFANIKNNLFETSDWISRIGYSGYAAGYGLESLLGPIEFKYSWSPETNKGFAWFSVGFWF
jgi:NTE family protein